MTATTAATIITRAEMVPLLVMRSSTLRRSRRRRWAGAMSEAGAVTPPTGSSVAIALRSTAFAVLRGCLRTGRLVMSGCRLSVGARVTALVDTPRGHGPALQKRRGARGASPFCVVSIVAQPAPCAPSDARRIQTESTGPRLLEAGPVALESAPVSWPREWGLRPASCARARPGTRRPRARPRYAGPSARRRCRPRAAPASPPP